MRWEIEQAFHRENGCAACSHLGTFPKLAGISVVAGGSITPIDIQELSHGIMDLIYIKSERRHASEQYEKPNSRVEPAFGT